MKRLLTVIFAIALIGVVFTSCKKDDETVLDNSITIEGTFTVGDKTFTNETFDLGAPELHVGYVMPNYQIGKSVVENMIYIEPADEFDLGNNTFLDYYLSIFSDVVGTTTDSRGYVGVYLNIAKETGMWLYCNALSTTVTKVGAVGEYIEGTYEGTFYLDKKVETNYPVKGKFKVKRIAYNPDL